MAKFCTQCGGQAGDDATVCPVCGAAFGTGAIDNNLQQMNQPAQNNMPQGAPQQPGQPAMNGQPVQPNPNMNANMGQPTVNPQPGMNPNVAAKPDTLMCILSYLGILALVPYLSKKEDAFIQFHAKQGLNLFIVCFLASLIVQLIASLLSLSILSLVSSAISIYELVMMIMGIVAATKGEMKVLPLLDKIQIVK